MTGSFARQTVVNTDPFIELTNQGQPPLRFYLKKEINFIGRDPQWSELKIPETGWTVLSRKQAVIQREGNDFRIYDGDRVNPSRNGIFINQTRITVNQGYLLKNGVQLQIGQDPRYQINLTYSNPSGSQITMPSKRRLGLKDLKEWPVELGRAPRPNYYSSIQLEAPTVSRLHATIYPDSKGGHILHDHSTNGTFINGKRLDKRSLLTRGDTIQIGPFNLLYTGDALELNNATHQIRLDAHHLLRKVKDKQGKEKVILNDISLVLEPGQLVALVGGSGAGKSTLMKSLLGISPTNSGKVYLNGDDLRRNWGIYRSQIGYVPQDDIIHQELTVEEVLTHACRLRLPPDIDVQKTVTKTLEQIKLSHVRHTFVHRLSGGQRKRVSIGVELLADPKLFFLDEPTSGLDPGLDKEMMNLLRELADQGRTVVLVTHATGNIETCDRLTFMGLGGNLCYFGPPQEALSFFEMPSEDFKYFADIYIKLNEGKKEVEINRVVDNWAQKYRRSPQYHSYIATSLTEGKDEQQTTDAGVRTGISPFKQLWLLCQRYWKLVNRDRISLILALIAGPITIALTALSLHNEKPLKQLANPELTQAPLALKLLFIFSCIAIWIGLSNSIREIVKESAIYFRERLLNLGLIPYISSKLLIRSGIAFLQTLLITAVVLIGFDSPASELISWPIGFAITTFLTLIASSSLSLMLSAYVKTENEGNGILPLVMIPQIIFSGVLFDLEGWSQKTSWLMLSRWSIGAYGSLADVNAMLPENHPLADEIFKASDAYQATWDNLTLNWGILAAHTFAYLLITLILQKRKDIF
jgi:ABC-type multidrug transport system ATPase subunit